MNLFSIETYIFVLPAVIIALAFHEFAHAFVADRLGDPTPRAQGRLTIDIRSHIDLWGFLALVFLHFGWGKPVETNPRYLKNPKVGTVLISVAGPGMNFIIAFIIAIVAAKLQFSLNPYVIQAKWQTLLAYVFLYNGFLGIFNLIPIPPLDGSKIITIFMSPKTYFKYMDFQARYDMQLIIGLFILMYIGVFNIPIGIAVNLIQVSGNVIANILPF